MKLSADRVFGTLVRCYHRFLADVLLDDGKMVTAHCANTGSMAQVSDPGSRVMLTAAMNRARKTRWDWQLIEVNGMWAGVNTAVPNRLLREGFETGAISAFGEYTSIRMEVPFGRGSRVDAVLEGPRGRMYVEAKNVTLVEAGVALFPDAPTERGRKHLRELVSVVSGGERAAMLFVVQRMDAVAAGVAKRIDPDYATVLRAARAAGVELFSWRASISPDEILLDRELPFIE